MSKAAQRETPLSHQSDDARKRERSVARVTIVGSVWNFVLLVFKLVAGIVGHSGAMIADAVHSLTDFITDVIVLVFVHVSGKPQDKDHQYGHGKYETLATAIIGLSLLAVGLLLLVNSIDRIWGFINGTEIPKPGIIALIAAVVSIGIKEILYRYTLHAGRRLNSPAVVANAWHHRSDALSSIGTLVGIGGAILLGHKWTVLDPIAAAVVSILIIKVAYDLLKDSMGDLLERSLPQESHDEIIKVIDSTPGVSDLHNLRTRRIGTRVAIDMHVRMRPDATVAESHALTRDIEQRLRDIFGRDTIVTIHVEPIKP